MVTERYFDPEVYEAVVRASRAAYRRAAELVAPRITASLVAAAGQYISEAEWAILTEEVSDAYGDAYLDALTSAGIEFRVLPSDSVVLDRLALQDAAVADLASTIRELLESFLGQMVEEGVPALEIQDRLLDAAASPLNSRKADMFARTATNTAINSGFEASFRAAGIPAVSWITRRDDRVRESHAEVDRDIVPTGSMFDVGGYEARYPGDPALPIGLRINCRCMLGWVDGSQVKRAVNSTRAEVYGVARELNIPNRSKMRKPELQLAVIEELCLQGLAVGPDCPDVLDDMNVATLLTYARVGGIKGRYRMRRPALLEAVRERFRDVESPTWLGFAATTVGDVNPESSQELAWDPSQPRHSAGRRDGGRWRSNYDSAGQPIRTFDESSRPSIFDKDQAREWNEERQRIRDHRRERAVVESVNREQLERFSDQYGKGIESVFPEGSVGVTTIPLPAASRRKDEPLYDREIVAERLAQPVQLSNFDPRTLHASQRGVTREGVEYYVDNPNYASTGRTYADQDQPGNRYPVIYRNPTTKQLVVLSGHHRAVAALVAGRPVKGILIDPRITVIRGGRRSDPNDDAAD